KNLLDDLPSSLSSCSSLRSLIISFNRFSSLPDVIYDCPSLETLLASDNQISFLNVDGFLKMRSLMTLDVSNNDISQVPPQLGLVQWLKHLELGGNSFRNPRPAVLAKGTASLLEYLRDRIPT
ncbi:PREDICTED: leucine-rich repeat-containing protein 40-like, partial [Amphimedon queenslandica]|uniref:Uncharacterized protein n=1 Tax=Amphimedon queenslandica TaxID=400682 RepID=A0A1X7SIT2_AMPQE